MDSDAVRELADQIAAKLFDGYGGLAVRLVREMPGKKIPGNGWCQMAVADVILREILKFHPHSTKKDASKICQATD